MTNNYLSTTEAGQILGLSRTQVFRLVKAGKIPAVRIGRNYLIKKDDLGIAADGGISKDNTKHVNETVSRVIHQYGDVIRKLGEE